MVSQKKGYEGYIQSAIDPAVVYYSTPTSFVKALKRRFLEHLKRLEELEKEIRVLRADIQATLLAIDEAELLGVIGNESEEGKEKRESA